MNHMPRYIVLQVALTATEYSVNASISAETYAQISESTHTATISSCSTSPRRRDSATAASFVSSIKQQMPNDSPTRRNSTTIYNLIFHNHISISGELFYWNEDIIMESHDYSSTDFCVKYHPQLKTQPILSLITTCISLIIKAIPHT